MAGTRRFGSGDSFFDRDDSRGQLPWQITEGSITAEPIEGRRGPNGARPMRRVGGRVLIFRKGKRFWWPWENEENRVFYPAGKKE